MKDSLKELQTFKDFAAARLRNHTEELETKYQDREPASEVRKQGFIEHQQMFEKELSDKIDELIAKDDNSLKPEMRTVKKTFIDKFRERGNL
jgi:hypothetical protein